MYPPVNAGAVKKTTDISLRQKRGTEIGKESVSGFLVHFRLQSQRDWKTRPYQTRQI